MITTLVTLGCYQSTGGPSKSIRAFQRALNARVVTWVDPQELAAEPLVFEEPTVVRGSPAPVLRNVLYPRRQDLAAAEQLVATSDLVSCHLFWRWHAPWVATMAQKHGFPFWLVPHGGLDPYVFQQSGFVKGVFTNTVARPFLNRVSALVCSTQREFDKAQPRAPHARRCVAPWPLEPQDFRVQDVAARARVRQRLGVPEDSLCLLFLGRLHPMKQPLETISALARSEAPRAHLILVGNPYGITTAECEAHARRLGVGNRVHVIGPVFGSAKWDYMDACDAYISLSHRENFNFSATEAMASGLPVILSPGNDLACDLVSKDCGWMLPTVDAAEEAIEAAASLSAAHLAEKGGRARQWAVDSLQFEFFQKRVCSFAEMVTAGYCPS